MAYRESTYDDVKRLLAEGSVAGLPQGTTAGPKAMGYLDMGNTRPSKSVVTDLLKQLQQKQLASQKQQEETQKLEASQAPKPPNATDYVNSIIHFQNELPNHIKAVKELIKRGVQPAYVAQAMSESGLSKAGIQQVMKAAVPDTRPLDEQLTGNAINTSSGPGVEATFSDKGASGEIPIQEKPTMTAEQLINDLLHFSTPSNLPLALSGRKVGDAVSAPASKGAYGIANLVSELISGNTQFEGTGKKSKPSIPLPKINLMSGLTGVSGLVPQAADQKERSKRAADFIVNKLLRKASGLPKETAEQKLYTASRKAYQMHLPSKLVKNQIFTTDGGTKVVMRDDGSIHQVI